LAAFGDLGWGKAEGRGQKEILNENPKIIAA